MKLSMNIFVLEKSKMEIICSVLTDVKYTALFPYKVISM